ncbi:hypothetical protein [Halocalculus aciditolerans]|uniref:Uncharacterized protein n=1 Tax=Halocalculus aciditolerans TaxID=1383812 RepID=A0A830F5U4_9EURY|nr:hypothetical protein [Halocalculus aciditolerans]GGL57447.1 hypothetical protein GCM10009039_14520 [Halocalculus aciditolerans]
MVNVRINDEELQSFLDDVDNQSEAVRDGLRLLMNQQAGRKFPELNDKQTRAYQWILEAAGTSGVVSAEEVVTVLAQEFSRGKQLVKMTILDPLKHEGYIEVEWGRIRPQPPGEMESSGGSSTSSSDGLEDDAPTVEDEWARQEAATVVGGESDD